MAGLIAAVNYVRNQPRVVAVSMSWGGDEFSGETTYDATFTTPAGHTGVAFFASSGNSGSRKSYPAASPNVVSVGGTSHTVSRATTSSNRDGVAVAAASAPTSRSRPTKRRSSRSRPRVAVVLTWRTVLTHVPASPCTTPTATVARRRGASSAARVPPPPNGRR